MPTQPLQIVGVSLEAPFDPRSWSGSSKFFFDALRSTGALRDAVHVRLPAVLDRLYQARAVSYPRSRWRARFNASVPRFTALTRMAYGRVERFAPYSAIMQIGARIRPNPKVDRPYFGYHDGNAALRYRFFDDGLLTPAQMRSHVAWEASVYARMQSIFVMSSWLASSFMSDFGIPASRLHVVGAGINFEELPPLLEKDFDRPHFLFVGREFERKGGPILLQAFAEVRRLVPHARLTIVGPPKPAVHGHPGVEFAGLLSKSVPAELARLQGLFEAATTLVLPSIYEPFGISLLEGMTYGMPCVATDRCAMPEIVQDGQTGLIAAAESAPALAKAMLELASQPGMAREFGRAGRRRVEIQFTWNVVADKVVSVVREESP